MTLSKPFVCIYANTSGSVNAASFTKEIPQHAIDQSSVLQQAGEVSEDEEAKLLLPVGAGVDFLDAWLKYLAGRRYDYATLSTESLVKSLQAADFLADEPTIRLCSVELCERLFDIPDHAPSSKKRRTRKNCAAMAHKRIQEVKDENEKIMQRLTPNVCLTLFAPQYCFLPPKLLHRMRYLHAPNHALVIESFFHRMLLEGNLRLPDQAEHEHHPEDYIEEIASCLTAAATLTQVTSLSLGSCWLSNCSPTIQDSLTVLLTSLPLLQRLEFDTNRLNSGAAESLGVALTHSSLQNLHSVLLLAKEPSLSADETTAAFHKLKILPELSLLRCSFLKEDCDEMGAFCSQLREMTTLTSLTLECCFLNRDNRPVGEGINVTGQVAGALENLKQLKNLNLDGSFPTDNLGEIEPVLDAIGQSLTGLTSLSLSDVHFRAYCDWMMANILAEEVNEDEDHVFGKRLAPMLSNLPELRYLNLTRYHIAEEIAQSIVDELGCLAQLRTLILTGVTEEEIFWQMFAAQVSRLSNLEVLCVSRNDSITNLNLGELAEGLAELPNLRWLHMNQCEIERDGVIEFAEHLPRMTALQELSMLSNRISPQGAAAIAESLKIVTQLKRLKLCMGDIGSAGLKAIAEALDKSSRSDYEEVLDIFHDHDEWQSDESLGGEDIWAGMEVEEIAQLLAAAEADYAALGQLDED